LGIDFWNKECNKINGFHDKKNSFAKAYKKSLEGFLVAGRISVNITD